MRFPISEGSIRAMDLRQIRTSDDDFGLKVYDPGLINTAVCRSNITNIDGERGILEYRGYPIEELAQRSNFLETAYLLIYGDLPTQSQMEEWKPYYLSHVVHDRTSRHLCKDSNTTPILWASS